MRDENEKIVAVLEIARTSGRHAEGSAADAELRPPLEQMPAVLWTTDRTLRITSNWGAGLAEAKIKPGELVGRTLHEYLRCEDPHGTPIAQHAQAPGDHLLAAATQQHVGGAAAQRRDRGVLRDAQQYLFAGAGEVPAASG